MENNYNVLDKYRNWTLELIKTDVVLNTLGYAVLMDNFVSDLNISTVIRNANAFGAEGLYYIGKNKIDRRGTVGCHHYTPVHYLTYMEEVVRLKERYNFVALECGVESVPITTFVWPGNPMIVIGNEAYGICKELLDLCPQRVNIPMVGSVRSLNAGTASGLAMFDYMAKLKT